jgi:hypothetical protein
MHDKTIRAEDPETSPVALRNASYPILQLRRTLSDLQHISESLILHIRLVIKALQLSIHTLNLSIGESPISFLVLVRHVRAQAQVESNLFTCKFRQHTPSP